MTNYNPEIFTKFIVDTVNADSALSALVSGIYTYALQDTNTPYLVIDIDSIQPLNAANVQAQSIAFTVHCFSLEAGYSEVFSIMEKVFTALQGKTAALTGYKVINTRFTDSEYQRLSDGRGIQASLEFRSVIQSV